MSLNKTVPQPMLFTPSNIAVRMLYVVTLLGVCASLYNNAAGLVMMLGSPRTYNVMNLLVGVVPNAAILLVFIMCVIRATAVLVGRCKLDTTSTSGGPRTLRIVAVILMAFSVIPKLFALAGAVSHPGQNGVGFALLLGSLGGGSPFAMILFEASRLWERERAERLTAPAMQPDIEI
jgi:hypothetical protein